MFRAQRCLSVPLSRLDRSIHARLDLQEGVDLDEMENYVYSHGYKVRVVAKPHIHIADKN